jgi:hypothetical protein
MPDHTSAPHSLAGYALVLVSVAIPGIMGVVGAIDPDMGWIAPSGGGGWILRTFVGSVALVLCAGAFGFVLCRKWSWWIIVVWGTISVFEVVRFAVASSAIVAILFPQVLAIVLAVYVWRRRSAFGIEFEGANA